MTTHLPMNLFRLPFRTPPRPPPQKKTCFFNTTRREGILSQSHQLFCSTTSLFTVDVTCTIYSKSNPVRQLLKLHDRCVFCVLLSSCSCAIVDGSVSYWNTCIVPCIYVRWNTWNSERWGAGIGLATGVLFVPRSLRLISTKEHAEALMWREP